MVAHLIRAKALRSVFAAAAKPQEGGEWTVLARSGSLEARMTRRKKDIHEAQRLRFEVFYAQGSAKADAASALVRRDVCRLDRICDHLVVFDVSAVSRLGKPKPKAVGC